MLKQTANLFYVASDFHFYFQLFKISSAACGCFQLSNPLTQPGSWKARHFPQVLAETTDWWLTNIGHINYSVPHNIHFHIGPGRVWMFVWPQLYSPVIMSLRLSNYLSFAYAPSSFQCCCARECGRLWRTAEWWRSLLDHQWRGQCSITAAMPASSWRAETSAIALNWANGMHRNPPASVSEIFSRNSKQ